MLIDELGQRGDSALTRARARDPELVRKAVRARREHPERISRWRPAEADWTLTTQLLKDILDRLGELTAIEASHPIPKGAKSRKPPRPFPTPPSLSELIEEEMRAEHLASIEADVVQAQERYRQLHAAS